MFALSRRLLVGAVVVGALTLALPGVPAVAAPGSAPAAAAAAPPDFVVEKTGGATQLSDTASVENPGGVVYDSRSGGPGALRAQETRTLDLFSDISLTAPADATAVILNVTAVTPTSTGWLAVWPSDRTRPPTSTLNFAPGTPTPNLAVVQLTATRLLKVMNGSAGTTHVLVSFRGWVRDNGGVQRPGSVTPTDATRVIDTRQAGPAVPAHGFRDVTVTGVGAPNGASAALLGIIAVRATKSGYLVAHPSDTARPNSTTLTYRVGGDRAALSLARLSAAGQVRVWNMSSAPVHLVIDSFGWVAGGDSTQTPASTAALTPVRVVDTRATGVLAGANPPVEIPVPTDNLTAVENRPSGVVLAITATAGTASGYLDIDVDGNSTIDDAARTPSIVNFGRGETVTNTTYVTVPLRGRLLLNATTTGSVHAIVDVVGLVRHRTETTGRLLTEVGATPVHPGGFATAPTTGLVVATDTEGRYRFPLSAWSAREKACGRAATPAGAVDPAYAMGCVGGTILPSTVPLGVGAKVLAADILVPRVGSATGRVTAPTGFSAAGTGVVLRRTDNTYLLTATVPANGQWTLPAVPAGDYVVSVNAPAGLIGETIDELPSLNFSQSPAEQQDRLARLTAAGATTFTVVAGSPLAVGEAQLLVPGTLEADVVDPDGSLTNVTLTWRHESGYAFSSVAGALLTRSVRPGRYVVCATEAATTVCSGGASTWQGATPVTVESGGTTSTTLTLP